MGEREKLPGEVWRTHGAAITYDGHIHCAHIWKSGKWEQVYREEAALVFSVGFAALLKKLQAAREALDV